MRIVLVFYQPPIPDSAAGRWGHLLVTGLVKRGHQVAAVCLGTPSQKKQLELILPNTCYDVTFVCPTERNRPISLIAKAFSWRRHFGDCLPDEFSRTVRQKVDLGCDILHVDQLAGAWAALPFKSKALVLHLCIYHVDLKLERSPSFLHRLALWRMLRAERYLCRQFQHHLAITHTVSDEVRKLHPSAIVQVAPITVDFSPWKFVSDKARVACSKTVCLFTHARWTPGILAVRRLCLRIWPRILARLPDARLQLVGPGMTEVMRGVGVVPNLEFHDFVDEIEPYWEQAGILLYAPEIGTGIKTKLLEAMAYGIPIVTNAQGAEGLGITDRIHAMIGEEDDTLARQAVELLTDIALQSRLRHAARAYLEETFNSEVVLDKLENTYLEHLKTVRPFSS